MNRFDLEQAIMQMWQTKEDLELLYHATEDDTTQNTLLGLINLVDLRCQSCFTVYENMVKARLL